MQVLWGRGFIDDKTLPYCDTTFTRRQDAQEIFNLDSRLRHIISMFTEILKENKGMMSTLLGWDQSWRLLPRGHHVYTEVSSCRNCLQSGRELYICVLPMPKGHTDRAKPVTEVEMKGARRSVS